MTDLLQELMDDVRADRMALLWQKYGKWIIHTAVSIVLVTAGVVYWNHHKREVAMQQTGLYLQASDALAKNDADAALKLLAQIPGDTFLHGAAMLKKAQSEQAAGKKQEADSTLAVLAKRTDVYGDIAKILMRAPADDAKGSPLEFSRREQAAWALVERGDVAQAAAAFAQLASAEHVPASMKERTQMMSATLADKGEK